ncbi:MAG: hypothetical protein M0C28_20510 [Candidatus Moduliflexus flocculans]|nr:hypothetical protein [Candidatus Moduliflexus flocculans]
MRKALPEDVLPAVAAGPAAWVSTIPVSRTIPSGSPTAEDGRIVGLVALKTHPDCLELCALGVDPGMSGYEGSPRPSSRPCMAEAPGRTSTWRRSSPVSSKPAASVLSRTISRPPSRPSA